MLNTCQIRRKLLTVFTFPGAPPPTWQWRPCPLLPALLSRSAPSQTGARLISFCVPLFFLLIIFKKNPLCRKKHPVVPEQYARVVGFGDPMDSEALWGSKNLHMPFLARSWWTPPEVFADEQYFLVICWDSKVGRLTLLGFQQNIDLTNYLDVQTFPDKVELEDWEEVPAWH